MMFVSLGLGSVLAITIIVVVSLITGGGSSTIFTSNALDNQQLPSLRLPSLAGAASGHSGTLVNGPWTKGHPAVVVFFASWCAPCKEELPRVANWVRSHDLGPVQFLGIDANDTATSGFAFARSAKVGFASGFDANGTVTAGTFKILELPDTVFVNANGTVRHVVIGAVTNEQLAVGVQELQ